MSYSNLKKLLIVLFLLTSLVFIFCCSSNQSEDKSPSKSSEDTSTSRPPEDIIKEIIVANTISSNIYKNINFKLFKILNEFDCKKNGENRYCIWVNFDLSYAANEKTEEIKRRGDKWSFVKRGNSWYGEEDLPK